MANDMDMEMETHNNMHTLYSDCLSYRVSMSKLDFVDLLAQRDWLSCSCLLGNWVQDLADVRGTLELEAADGSFCKRRPSSNEEVHKELLRPFG